MIIEGLGGIDQISKEVNIRGNNEVARPSQKDAVEFSPQARIKGEWRITKEQVHSVADGRADIVARAKERINDPAYLTDLTVVETVAERISSLFLS